MTIDETVRLHATCVVVGRTGVLLRGPPGAGKSDLALRLVEAGARLVADDQTVLTRRGDALVGRAPASLRGLIEVRGVGIVRLPAARLAASARILWLVDLVDDDVDRLPEPASEVVLGVVLSLLRLRPFEASASAKIGLALTATRFA